MVKKYQQRFRKVKEEMGQWEDFQSQLLSQFTRASAIIQRLQVIQDSKNYSTLECVQGIKDAVLTKQMESLQTVLLSMNKTLDGFHSIVLSLEKIFRDGRQLVKGGSAAPTATQLKQRVGVKPSLSDCLEGLKILYEMHHSEYLLKVSVVSALAAVALKKSASDHLGAFQQLLVDQPNITQEDVTIVAHYGSSPPSCS